MRAAYNLCGYNTAVKLYVGKYQNNGNLAILMFCVDPEDDAPNELDVDLEFDEDDIPGEEFGDLTVNISPLPDYHAAIDTNNLADAEKFIMKYKLGKPTGMQLFSGYCSYPVYEFYPDALKQYAIQIDY